MKTHRISLGCLLLFAYLLLLTSMAYSQQPCEKLVDEKLPHVTISSAAYINDPLGFSPPKTPGIFGTPPGLKVTEPFCRIIGHINPVPESRIGFEVWLPPAVNWNNRFLTTGNPAFEGAIKYQGLAASLAQGYAAASTDTGHLDPGHEWGMGQPEKLIDWAHRAVHETTVAAKHLIEAFYGQPPQYSYFGSCHNGGRQGLAEAQRYPDDYDGILAGDPAFHLTHLQPGSEYLSWVALKDGVDAPGYIPPDKYPVLNRAALDACDELDGVKDDAIEDPTRCDFDPASIQCQGPDKPSCLTAAQVDTARKLYTGAQFSDGTQIYSGFEPGSELLWGAMIQGPEPLFINNGFFKYIVFEDPDWDFHTFDVDADTRRTDERLGALINSIDPDLKAFNEKGGKLILYQSWNETWVPPRYIRGYYDQVTETMGGLDETKDFFRLFMVPDMGMCPATFPGTFNAMEALRKWTEEGVAPDQIKASYRDGPRVYKTRPVCAYPDVAIYKGEGDPSKAENFRCGRPTW
jgi:feruloyl esterase